jgi:NAD(P)H-hydrate epimerase
VADIGIPAYLTEQVTSELIDPEWAKSVLPHRPLQANKGTFGKVLIIAGSINYIGAASLASSGALRVGAGLVTLATATTLQSILASKLTEVTYLPLPEAQRGVISPSAARIIHQNLKDYNTLLLGCGLGQSRATAELVENTLLRAKSVPLPLVLDADALNTLARIPTWWHRLSDDAILTPHPGEMARLAEVPVTEVQIDRLGIAKRAASSWNKTIVLKGAYTVIATPDGRTRTCPIANPGLASAGTGDVLSGAIAGLVAQGMSLFDAASLGVFLHGEAGEMVKSQLGDAGMLASDLLPMLPLVIKQIKSE